MRIQIAVRGVDIGNQIYGFSRRINIDGSPISPDDLFDIAKGIYANGYWPRFGTILTLINFDEIVVGTMLLKLCSLDSILLKEILEITAIKTFSDGSQWFYFKTLFPEDRQDRTGMMSKDFLNLSTAQDTPSLFLIYDGDIPITNRRR
jgi:hypothetical protein